MKRGEVRRIEYGYGSVFAVCRATNSDQTLYPLSRAAADLTSAYANEGLPLETFRHETFRSHTVAGRALAETLGQEPCTYCDGYDLCGSGDGGKWALLMVGQPFGPRFPTGRKVRKPA